jgi:hypothetical protein
VLPRARGLRDALSPEALARAAAVGLALLAPTLVLLGLASVPVTPATIAAAAAVFAALRARPGRAEFSGASAPDAGALRLSFVVPTAAWLVFAAKVAAVPVWAWDHYMVWGMKSRVMLSGGFLDLAVLRAAPYSMANADYPLGLPMAWRILALGAEPSAPVFRIAHVVFGLGVALAVRQILREADCGPVWPDAIAGFAAISPLFWDTESLGIAEMPLAWAALTAFGLVLRAARGGAGLSLAAGVATGALPWIKKQGGSLAILIVGAAALLAGRAHSRPEGKKTLIAIAAVAAGMWGAAAALEHRFLLRGRTSFFAGDWLARTRARLDHPLSVLGPAGRELLEPAWFGFWIALAAAAIWAVRRRDAEAIAAFAVVAAQAALYVMVYFATYLVPEAHVRSSLFRLLAALLPLGAVGIGLAARAGPAREEPAAPISAS